MESAMLLEQEQRNTFSHINRTGRKFLMIP